jgi:hypothetical protein
MYVDVILHCEMDQRSFNVIKLIATRCEECTVATIGIEYLLSQKRSDQNRSASVHLSRIANLESTTVYHSLAV